VHFCFVCLLALLHSCAVQNAHGSLVVRTFPNNGPTYRNTLVFSATAVGTEQHLTVASGIEEDAGEGDDDEGGMYWFVSLFDLLSAYSTCRRSQASPVFVYILYAAGDDDDEEEEEEEDDEEAEIEIGEEDTDEEEGMFAVIVAGAGGSYILGYCD